MPRQLIIHMQKIKLDLYFDIIYKEETGKYRNYVIYTNKIVEGFFKDNNYIIYVDCLYADGENINTYNMFSECSKLFFVDISKIKTKELSSTFYLCENLKYVFLPQNKFEIDIYSFYKCNKLKLVINIENCSTYWISNNFNEANNLLYLIVPKKIEMDTNELMCKYFDSTNNSNEEFYPTNISSNNPSYIITTNEEYFIKCLQNGYKGKFLMSEEIKNNLQEEEIIKKLNEQKDKKENVETLWKEGIVNERVVTFEDFKFKDDNAFEIVKNEEEEVKTEDQIFLKFVLNEINNINNFLRGKMQNWNKISNQKEKNYENFKKIFVFDYKRKPLFVPELDIQENEKNNIN